MRGQYKVLSEKYKLVQENEQGDLSAGINELERYSNLIKFFKWFSESDKEHSNPVDYLRDWWNKEQYEVEQYIAYDVYHMSDDAGTDFEAEPDDVYKYIQDVMSYLFRKTPQEVANVAPGVTYEQVMEVVDKWLSEGI